MIFDDDVDQIVRTSTLSDIEKSLRTADFMLSCDPEPEVETYWLERQSVLQLALDIAQYYFDNDLPIEQVPVSWRFDYRMDTAEKEIREFNTSLQEHFKTHKPKETPNYIYSNIKGEDDLYTPSVEQGKPETENPATSPQHSATSQQDYGKDKRNVDNKDNDA